MTPSPWLYSFIKKWEQFRPTAYKPTRADVWTIAWGHTAGVKQGDTCTTAQGEVWLEADTKTAVDAVNDYVTAKLSQSQFDALCSLCFNIGVANFASSHLCAYVNMENFAAASAEFPKWDHQHGQVLEGLLERRLAERAHFDLAA